MLDELNVSRRAAVGVAAAASLLMAGCAPAPKELELDVALDKDAPFLRPKGQEGASIPGDSWVQLDVRTVQVQVSGSSIPGLEVEDACMDGDVLHVTMREVSENTPMTMDYVLYQFMVSASEPFKVAAVVLARNGEESELPRGVVADAGFADSDDADGEA